MSVVKCVGKSSAGTSRQRNPSLRTNAVVFILNETYIRFTFVSMLTNNLKLLWSYGKIRLGKVEVVAKFKIQMYTWVSRRMNRNISSSFYVASITRLCVFSLSHPVWFTFPDALLYSWFVIAVDLKRGAKRSYSVPQQSDNFNFHYSYSFLPESVVVNHNLCFCLSAKEFFGFLFTVIKYMRLY
jgi:hypothetical protein